MNWKFWKGNQSAPVANEKIGRLQDDAVIWKSLRQVLSANGSTVVDPYNKNIWVYSSIKSISNNITRVPFNIYKDTDSPSPLERKEVAKGPLYDLLQNPNPLMTYKGLIDSTTIHLELFGEAFWVFDRKNVTQIPQNIWVLNPRRFKPKVHDGNLVAWEYEKDAKTKIIFGLHEVLYFKYYNPYDPIRGMSPLEAAQISVDQDYFANQYNKKFFENGAEPGGVIEVDEELSTTVYNRMVQQFEERHQGRNNAHKVALLEGGGKWKDVKITQKDLDFVKLKKISRDEIFAAYKTNPVILGFYEDIKSYEGIKAAHKAFWQECLVPKITYIEETINQMFIKKLSGKFVGEFDFSKVEALQDGFDKKIQTAWLMSRMGFPLNVINEKLALGLPKLAWGDVWWAPATVIPVSTGSHPDPTWGKEAPAPAFGKGDKPAKKPAKEKPKKEDQDNNGGKPKDSKKHPVANEFDNLLAILEKRFESKTKRFLFEQRKEVIGKLWAQEEKIFPDNEVERLKKSLQPLYRTAFKIGTEMVAREVKDIDYIFDESDYALSITRRLDTIPKQIVLASEKTLTDMLKDAVTDDEKSDITKKAYNFISSKAKHIARTEARAAINEGRYMAMKEQNISTHKWVHNGDDLHKELEGKKAVLGQKFENTEFRYPCDLEVKDNVVGCTCITVPTKEEV